MIDLTRTALSGVVASVLLMGPNVSVAAPVHETPGPTQGKHRKSAQNRQTPHHVAQAQRWRRSPGAHPAAAHTPAYVPARPPALRTVLYTDDQQRGPGAHQPSGDHQIGLASWYGGRRWQGNRTSSGEVYDQDALTAAHASLPLGTRVRVALVDGGRDVIVTINDRPGTRKRIIDLSRAAARELGILERGIAMVSLTPL